MEVMPTGKRFWRLRYSEGGARRKLTLGQYPAVSLGEARAKRDELREAKARGIAPHEVLNPARKPTFSDVALEWFGKHVEPVRTAGHAQMGRRAGAWRRRGASSSFSVRWHATALRRGPVSPMSPPPSGEPWPLTGLPCGRDRGGLGPYLGRSPGRLQSLQLLGGTPDHDAGMGRLARRAYGVRGWPPLALRRNTEIKSIFFFLDP